MAQNFDNIDRISVQSVVDGGFAKGKFKVSVYFEFYIYYKNGKTEAYPFSNARELNGFLSDFKGFNNIALND